MRKNEEKRKKRKARYYLIIIAALAVAAGQIATVTSREGDTAFLSANDRSRWCTIATLVEQGTYAITNQITIPNEEHPKRTPWHTIDRVQHLGPSGKQEDYSSKPPLFPTLVAGVYKVVNICTGMRLTDQPIYVARIILLLVNLPLLALFYWSTIDSIDRVCRSEWARLVASFGVCFGTMLLPFSVSLNNHLPAAAATGLAMWLYLFAAEKLDPHANDQIESVSFWIWFAVGVSAAFAAANELPALSMMVFWGILVAMLSRASIAPFILGVVVVAAGFFGTNWLAHQSLRPAYMHRGNGPLIASLTTKASQYDDEALMMEISETVDRESLFDAPVLTDDGPAPPDDDGPVPPDDDGPGIADSDEEGRWVITDGAKKYALLRDGQSWQINHWDDWYEYDGTYWKDGTRKGIDRGEPSRLVYLLHMTIGHHGLFSLTPIWVLLPIALLGALSFGPDDFRRLALAVLVATVVCLLFYLARPLIDRNYGGKTICFRWLLWFAPLWMMMIAPKMDEFAESQRHRVALLGLLALSIFSMSMSIDSPWNDPWLYKFWQFLGWIDA